MSQPTPPDLETTGKVAGLAVAAIALIGFGKRSFRWSVRALGIWAFAAELRRGEQTAAEMRSVHDRLDGVEERLDLQSARLDRIPVLEAGQERIERSVDELRGDVKLILRGLGQAEGRSQFGPFTPESERP